ncbi:nitrate ABC transporter substrate-binding protein [Microvirga terricola]|uniref:Nitrate ABC transporter substrate-binding protein n=1 Tax=Microvirga terricola TaxID=2719797 RepID=A0ABX0VA23_9HYPH|nr:nitrate ABC transporter substrate-binding protein [Microvirga terricola]NIX76664.1 nitrate ABC transporter substrate-binding protein [Microvirga terricola]
MSITIRLAVRDWDYIVPLALGDVRSDKFDLHLDRVQSLPEDLASDPRYDAGEVSFSRYSLGRARGETSIVGVPYFLMRGFRHRCIITAKTSNITSLEQLAGKKIGLTGWQDSGNTWTRAILRRIGIGIEDAYWFVGRLTEAHPITDRLSGYGRPGRIEAAPGERPMMELLEEGVLDAVFTPFMPPGFFDADSKFRQLLPDFRKAEVDYFNAVGYVPGIHLLGIKPAIVKEYPWLPQALSEVLDESTRVWLERRAKYADTTPWIIDEIRQVARDLPASWDRNGFAANEKMIADFATELHAQNLTDKKMTPRDLFPAYAA